MEVEVSLLMNWCNLSGNKWKSSTPGKIKRYRKIFVEARSFFWKLKSFQELEHRIQTVMKVVIFLQTKKLSSIPALYIYKYLFNNITEKQRIK